MFHMVLQAGGTLAVDSFLLTWNNSNVYMFLTFSIIGQTLAKMK